jgi:KDO2-lipid IV(A) lauroyltransferase
VNSNTLDPAERGRRKWVGHGLSNSVVYGGLLHGAVRLPLALLRAISFAGNSLAVVLLRKTVADIAANYREALGVSPKESRRLARQLFFEYGRTTVDLWRMRASAAELAPRLTTLDHDAEFLRGARDGGRGLLLASAHVGNWEMGAAAASALGVRVVVLGQPELDPAVHEMRLKVRKRLGVESIEIGATVATALRVRSAIESGAIVALAADRTYEEDRILVPYFGRATPFLRSPALLARFCGCAVLPAFFLRNRDGTYRGLFFEPVRPDPSLAAEEDARRIMTAVARATETAVRQEPAQWFNFFRFWESGPPPSPTGGATSSPRA